MPRHWINQLQGHPTPLYLIDIAELQTNLDHIRTVKNQTGCQVIVALKGFATVATFDLLSRYLDGATASSVYEARLARDTFDGECHIHALAMDITDCHAYNQLGHHLTFNSWNQYHQFVTNIPNSHLSLGIRINPGIGFAPVDKYDPCSPNSRLGIPLESCSPDTLSRVSGIHFHALCEETTAPLAAILAKIEAHFGDALHGLDWMNWGGGHLITDAHYDRDHLIALIRYWQSTYNLQVILEPGEAIGRHCGYYVTTIRDIIQNTGQTAMCDISFTAHMPDVLEFPYKPVIYGSADDKPYRYSIGGNTCLAGDVCHDYGFDAPLQIGDPLVFMDMGHYTLVKTSHFNGVKQPAIGTIVDTRIVIHSHSCYFNFKERLS